MGPTKRERAVELWTTSGVIMQSVIHRLNRNLTIREMVAA
jgi:hypothetical protein